MVSGQTVNVSFDNVLKRGSLSVVKNAEDSFMSGMRFHLYGTAACGQPVDAYATTDENGVATFRDILISGEEGYSLEEVDTAVRYVTPDIQNVRVFWNETVNAEMSNRQLERFCALDAGCSEVLERLIERLGLSARAYSRILKVARTIADLAGSKEIRPEFLMEAAGYRFLDRMGKD